MAINFIGVNYFAVFVSAVVYMIIGAFWYSPIGFGKMWMHLTGVDFEKLTKEEKSKNMMSAYLINFLAAVLLTLTLALFLKGIGAVLVTDVYLLDSLHG